MNLRRELGEPSKPRDAAIGKALIHDEEDKGDGWKVAGCNDGSKERKEKGTLENNNSSIEQTTGKGPHETVSGVPLQAVMATTTQPYSCRTMKGKQDESRANQKYSFPNLLSRDQAQTSGEKNWTLDI